MFKKTKTIILVLITILFLSMLFGGAQAKEVVLKLAHGLPTDHPMHLGTELFADLVNEGTNGEVTVEIFPARQLGGNREMFEGVMAGTIDICLTDNSAPDFIDQPIWRILQAGYVFQNQRHAFLFLHSPAMRPLIEKLENEAGITMIETSWYFGVRHLTCNKPIYGPDDFKGLKIRVPQVPSFVETLIGMGATPTPIDFAELYTSLKTGVVDGQENPFIQIYISKFYEAQKYLMLTSHLVSNNAVYMNVAKLNSLSPEQQQVIRASIYEAARYQDRMILDSEQDYLDKLKEEGMEVIQPDTDAFTKSVKKHFFADWFTPEEKEFYEKIEKFQKL